MSRRKRPRSRCWLRLPRSSPAGRSIIRGVAPTSRRREFGVRAHRAHGRGGPRRRPRASRSTRASFNFRPRSPSRRSSRFSTGSWKWRTFRSGRPRRSTGCAPLPRRARKADRRARVVARAVIEGAQAERSATTHGVPVLRWQRADGVLVFDVLEEDATPALAAARTASGALLVLSAKRCSSATRARACARRAS